MFTRGVYIEEKIHPVVEIDNYLHETSDYFNGFMYLAGEKNFQCSWNLSVRCYVRRRWPLNSIFN